MEKEFPALRFLNMSEIMLCANRFIYVECIVGESRPEPVRLTGQDNFMTKEFSIARFSIMDGNIREGVIVSIAAKA